MVKGHSHDLIKMWTVMDQGTDADHNRCTPSWGSGQEQNNGKGRRRPMTSPPLRPDTIEKLSSAVYPAFAMVAGMQLDVFTPLKDGPLSVEDIAAALAVNPHKLRPLLYALVAAGLLTVQDERFANTPEAAHFLVVEALLHESSRRSIAPMNSAFS